MKFKFCSLGKRRPVLQAEGQVFMKALNWAGGEFRDSWFEPKEPRQWGEAGLLAKSHMGPFHFARNFNPWMVIHRRILKKKSHMIRFVLKIILTAEILIEGSTKGMLGDLVKKFQQWSRWWWPRLWRSNKDREIWMEIFRMCEHARLKDRWTDDVDGFFFVCF